VTFSDEHAEANLNGLSFADKKQHIDNYTLIEHSSPNCLSNQIYKNILDDESTGAFSGRIHVARDAQQTNAFQRNNNVLLSDKAKMNTKPQLIIDADDVKCSHGATVGQINEEALFFLRARGIGEKDARMMLMNAFAHEVVRRLVLSLYVFASTNSLKNGSMAKSAESMSRWQYKNAEKYRFVRSFASKL